ncbi:MAG: hypothetical protein WAR80_11810, partial [Ferruginibacter sp.]
MKTPLMSCKRLFTLMAAMLLFAQMSVAQKNGVLPLSGMKFFQEGIETGAIEIKIDGAQLLSNRLPLNKEIEIRLEQL